MVNTVKTDLEGALEALQAEGVHGEPHPWLKNCLVLSRSGSLEELEAFQSGLFYVQDPASRLAVMALDPEPGSRVLDMCAAPGGKSFAAAIQMKDQGEIWSCDLHPHKKTLIQKGAQRLGLTCIRPQTADGKVRRPEWEGTFDRVLVDAPCSGLGVIRKKPDIRFKDPEPLAGLPQVQSAILDNAAGYVKPGVCWSTLPARFWSGKTGRSPTPSWPPTRSSAGRCFLPGRPGGEVSGGQITLWPQVHGTDGFYICKLRKDGEA